MNDEFRAKMKGLSRDDLLNYENAAVQVQKSINIIAVVILLGMMMFTNIFTLVFGGIAVYIMSHVSVNVSNSLDYIRTLLSKMSNDK